MQQEEGILVLLAIALLSICYFSPIVSEGFTSEAVGPVTRTTGIVPTGYLNPQGSIGTVNGLSGLRSQGSAVTQEKWQPGNVQGTFQQAPGTAGSLQQSGTMFSFPFMEQSKLRGSKGDNNTINLIKPDGVVLGGYLPQILRPFDTVTAQKPGSPCKWPCYSSLKFQKWCNEDNAINYHAMRPLISPKDYNKNLRKLFNIIIDKNSPNSLNVPAEQYTAVFCTENESTLMAWLMNKIALAVEEMPEMQRNGPWKTERFYETDVQLYQFTDDNNQVSFKIIFNLYNPLRSVSTLVEATVHVIGGEPLLKGMDFVNDGEMNDYMAPANGWGPINAQNVGPTEKFGISIEQFEPLGFPQSPEGMKMWEESYKNDPNDLSWNYQNTLLEQKFNKYGFYSNVPSDNITIEGGVPDSLLPKLAFCKEENLMSCATPGYTGMTAVSAKALNEKYPKIGENGVPPYTTKLTALDGNVKNVYDNPRLIYSVPTLALRDAKIEGITQEEHVIGSFRAG